MKDQFVPPTETAKSHFFKRAKGYDHSSNWVKDQKLINMIFDLSQVTSESIVLDLAAGTGKISGIFQGKVKKVIGIDISQEMVEFSTALADEIILCNGEHLPFKNMSFDVCVCRQGLQFMELNDALQEMHRVLKIRGIAVLAHLTSFCEEDSSDTFYIQRLRNPSRRNFFKPAFISNALLKTGFTEIENSEYLTEESVNQWIYNGALSERIIEKIKKAYINSSEIFKKKHDLKFLDHDIFDSMRMELIRAKKNI